MSLESIPNHSGKYALYREDDNGARFLIARFDSREAAEKRAAELARGGHKQHYFVESESESESVREGDAGKGYSVIHVLTEEQAGELHALYQNEWWSAGRTLKDVRTMLAHTDFVFGVTPAGSGQLVGFARVLTDYAFKALLFDVIVHPEHRAAGLGSWLITQVTTHPVLARVKHIELFCRPELEGFYGRWGFESQAGEMVHMRRCSELPPGENQLTA